MTSESIPIDDLDERVAVQAKRHAADVGNYAVAEVYAGLTHYRCKRGMLAISKKLTSQAKKLLESLPNVTLLSGKYISQLAGQLLGEVLLLELESRREAATHPYPTRPEQEG